MSSTNLHLHRALAESLGEIDTQIKHIKNDLKRDYPEELQDKINVWYWTRSTGGTYALEDLLVARAGLISAMASLKAAELNEKAAELNEKASKVKR